LGIFGSSAPDRMPGMSYKTPRGPAPWMLWVRRHKVLAALGAIAFLVLITVAAQASTTKGTPSPGATSTAVISATRAAAQPSQSQSRTPSPSPTTAAPSPRTIKATVPVPVPATRAAVPPPPPATTASPPAKAGCHPLSNSGTCYEPGEYCRTSDHGASGVAGDGKSIICEDNDGWRWEPA
jgi:cytoskeletal protein RodZ